MAVDPSLGSLPAAECAALSAWQLNIHLHEGFVRGSACVGTEHESWDPLSVCVLKKTEKRILSTEGSRNK